jgi:hypothetical protein
MSSIVLVEFTPDFMPGLAWLVYQVHVLNRLHNVLVSKAALLCADLNNSGTYKSILGGRSIIIPVSFKYA